MVSTVLPLVGLGVELGHAGQFHIINGIGSRQYSRVEVRATAVGNGQGHVIHSRRSIYMSRVGFCRSTAITKVPAVAGTTGGGVGEVDS